MTILDSIRVINESIGAESDTESGLNNESRVTTRIDFIIASYTYRSTR